MVAPQTFLGPGAALTEHYRRIGESGEVPVILQDFPPVNGVVMSPQQMPEFVEAVASITTIKLEETSKPSRTSQILGIVGKRATVLEVSVASTCSTSCEVVPGGP